MKKVIITVIATMVLCSVCSRKPSVETGNDTDYGNVTIRLARQYGMSYTAVYIMEELGFIEKHLPGVKLEWSQLAGGSAMNEALIAGQLDVAFMGIPPLLIAWSKGVDYRIAEGFYIPPMELMIKNDKIKSISDLKETDKIAVPGVGSIQHILLAMAAQKTLGNPNALDTNIVTMGHTDAYAAFISGTDIAGHFAALPYIAQESKAGYRSILTSNEVYKQGASNICVITKSFHDKQKDAYNGLLTALGEAIDLINAKDPIVFKIVSKVEKISEEDAQDYLYWPGSLYDTTVYGAMGLAKFMFEQGFIDKCPENISDIAWPNVKAVE